MSERKRHSYSFRYNNETGEFDLLPPKGVQVSGNIFYQNIYNEQPALDMFEDKLAEMTRKESFPDVARMLDKIMR